MNSKRRCCNGVTAHPVVVFYVWSYLDPVFQLFTRVTPPAERCDNSSWRLIRRMALVAAVPVTARGHDCTEFKPRYSCNDIEPSLALEAHRLKGE